MAQRVLPYVGVLLIASCCGVWWVVWRRQAAPERPEPPRPHPAPTVPFEEWARREFLRRYPGKKPLNWAIAKQAVEFHRNKPMGRFVLGRNDCSDFTEAVLDEALGAGARFRRKAEHHICGPDPNLWEFYLWEPGMVIMPGDEIAVRHSPHYPPSDNAPWHCGIVGTDGMVYDWTKLRAWDSDRYGRHSVEWFLHNSLGPNETVVRRLRPLYRYLIEPIPHSSLSSERRAQVP